MPLRIGDRPPQHLIAAAQAEHQSAAAAMRGDIDVKAGGAQRGKIGDGRLRARQDHEIGVAGKRRSRPQPNQIDRGLGLQRIEIVEIGNVRQDRHGDAQRAPAILPARFCSSASASSAGNSRASGKNGTSPSAGQPVACAMRVMPRQTAPDRREIC